jgi:hypothetical protein
MMNDEKEVPPILHSSFFILPSAFTAGSGGQINALSA